MLLLGIDLGTSSIKVSVIDAQTNRRIVSTQYPDSEAAIISEQQGWAEQDPNLWWEYTKLAIKKLNIIRSISLPLELLIRCMAS